jgi:hypothetical protein
VRGNTPEGLFNIPEQSKPSTGSFDTRPRQVEAWVAALPMANTGESTRRIYNALREINRLQIPAQDRFKTLEHFRAPVFHLSEVLKKHYVSQNLPLSPKNQKIAELAIQLQSEMAIGYKCIFQNKRDPVLGMLSGKVLTQSIHRSIYFLSNVLLCSYQIYIQHPENTWLQIHRLYRYAEEHDLHHTPVKANLPNEAERVSTISDIYKQILLLAFAGPYRLRQQITETVYNALSPWTAECRIKPYAEAEKIAHGFFISLNTDAAPGYFRDDGSANPTFHRFIDTTELVNKLSSSALIPEDSAINIPENVQQRLIQSWSGKTNRAFSRTVKTNETDITLGLSATHHFIDEVIRPLLTEFERPCPTATESFPTEISPDQSEDAVLDEAANYTSVPVFGISNLDDHTPDVWDPDFTYRANNPTFTFGSSSEEDAQKKAMLYSPLTCKEVNESAAGYCLLGNLNYGKDSQKVQVGELVGIRDDLDPDSIQLSIGVIRRLKSWNNGLEIGIQKLAPCADAIATATPSDEDRPEKYQRSLILPGMPGINQPATIITHAWHRVGDQLITNVHGQYSRVQLVRQLENTGVFNQFEFKIIEEKDKKPDMKGYFITSEDEFDAVWKLI